MRFPTLCVFAALPLIPAPLAAQLGDSASVRDEHPAPRSVLTVRRVSGSIALDGRLDERAWSTADSTSDLRQREPAEGSPATERTVVKVLRDDDALYIGARMYDRNAAALVATQLRRDSDLGSDDSFGFIIDSFHDRRGAFAFQTNPNGAMWDAQAYGGEERNENWNGIWDVAVTRDSAGWTAEFRVPLRTLRFTAGAGATFGFNARRTIRRKNEEDLWQSWQRNQGVFQFLNEGELVGLGVLERARNIEVKPYALARYDAPGYSAPGTRSRSESSSGKLGADAKVAVTPTLTADFTVNTDFAQVEADRQIVNLSRFPLFFPEKREFFLESSGIFTFGSREKVLPFYSRRVGLDRAGRPVPILGGARLTGKAGPWAIGLLDARTGGAENANDAVIRIRHDLLDRSYVGALFTSRSGPGLRGSQTTLGADGSFPLVVGGKNVTPFFWLSGTRNPDRHGIPAGWRVGIDAPNDLLEGGTSLHHIDAGYNPALGFVRRAGILESSGHMRYHPRPPIPGVRRLDLGIIPEWDIIADESGSVAHAKTWQTASFEWRPLGASLQNGDSFEANVQRKMDAPPALFEIFPGVSVRSGRYWWTRYELQYQSSSGRPLSLAPLFSWGKFYDGHGRETSLRATYRGGGHIILAADVSQQEVHVSSGRFRAVSGGGRLEYAFSTRSDFLAFVQYNNESRRADFNFRYHWTPVIGDDFFVVWNSGYSTSPDARYRFGRTPALAHPLNGALIIKGVHRLAF